METQELVQDLIQYCPKKYKDTILEAIELSTKYHLNQKRLSGDDFINHPLRTARTVAKMGLDTTSILTAIFHNSLSCNPDNTVNIEKEIKERFGEKVITLVKECNYISKATGSHDTEYEIINKFILNKSKDIRPVIVRLADTLDNVRTIEYMPSDRLNSKIQKVFHVYAPLAEYLNLDDMKKELEERALHIYRPEEYKYIKEKLELHGYTTENRDKYVKHITKITEGIKPKPLIYGRVKSIYSIYNKQKKYLKEGINIDLSRIEDVLAFRVVTDTEDNCFNVLESIMDKGEIITERFDDYITSPKKNGYKALQGPVIFKEISKNPIEVQVLTYDMYYHNTYGPASHIAYKESQSRYANPTEKYKWVEDVHKQISRNISLREDKISIPIKVDIFPDNVYAFTPKGKIIQLDKGDTPVDFAYRVHTDIGNSMVGVKVNGSPVKLDYKVKTGDTIEIKTQSGKKTAKPEWLTYANSPSTQYKIQKSWKNS
jgi:GTP diphosphokinase / guanosine-3',5'-bis(diphosphate) 3'-diphosphatase